MSVRDSGKRPDQLHVVVIRQGREQITPPNTSRSLAVRRQLGQWHKDEPTLVLYCTHVQYSRPYFGEDKAGKKAGKVVRAASAMARDARQSQLTYLQA